MNKLPVWVFFNFRSPYCYLISKNLFTLCDDFDIEFVWRPLGGWTGRSPPERAKHKLPIARQDVARWCKRMNIPMNPPPITTDPTQVAAASFYAEQEGKLKEYIIETMNLEWSEGVDIGQTDAIETIAQLVGLDKTSLVAAADSADNLEKLNASAQDAEKMNVIGVPTLVIEDQIFWGNDRLDFVREELEARGVAKS